MRNVSFFGPLGVGSRGPQVDVKGAMLVWRYNPRLLDEAGSQGRHFARQVRAYSLIIKFGARIPPKASLILRKASLMFWGNLVRLSALVA